MFVKYDDNAFPSPQIIGSTAPSISGLGPADETMIDTIFIMPNKSTNPDATLMIVVDEIDPPTNPKTYQYVYVGNINDLPSDVLTESSIVDIPGTNSDSVMSQKGVTDLVSEYNVSTNNNNAEYTFAQAVALVPASLQKSGLTIKYIDSTTHEYVVKRLMNSTWNTTESNWQGIDDKPTANSENLVKSGGVYKNFQSSMASYIYAPAIKTSQEIIDFYKGIDVNGELVDAPGACEKFQVKYKALYEIYGIYTPSATNRLGYALYTSAGEFISGGRTINGEKCIVSIDDENISYIRVYRHLNDTLRLYEFPNIHRPITVHVLGNSYILENSAFVEVYINTLSVNYNGSLLSWTIDDTFQLVKTNVQTKTLIFNMKTESMRISNIEMSEIDSNDIVLLILNNKTVIGGELYDYYSTNVSNKIVSEIKESHVVSAGAKIEADNTTYGLALNSNGSTYSASNNAYINEYTVIPGEKIYYVDCRVPAERLVEKLCAVQFWNGDTYLGYDYFCEERARNQYYGLLFIPEGCTKILVSGNTLSVDANLYRFNRNGMKTTFWTSKKCVWIGDSISWGSVLSDHTKAYPYLVCDALGMTLENYSIGGSIIAKGADTTYMNQQGGQNYDDVFLSYQEFEDAIQSGTIDETKKYLVRDGQLETVRPYGIYHYSNDTWVKYGETSTLCGRTPIVDCVKAMSTDADLVIIAGGTNDFYYMWSNFGDMSSRDKTTFYGALHLICQYLVETYTNKQIVFINLIKRWQEDTWTCKYPEDTNALGKTMLDYCRAIKEVCEYYSIPVIDLYADSGMNPAFDQSLYIQQSSTFYTHPNVSGHRRIASFVEAFLRNLRIVNPT